MQAESDTDSHISVCPCTLHALYSTAQRVSTRAVCTKTLCMYMYIPRNQVKAQKCHTTNEEARAYSALT